MKNEKKLPTCPVFDIENVWNLKEEVLQCYLVLAATIACNVFQNSHNLPADILCELFHPMLKEKNLLLVYLK